MERIRQIHFYKNYFIDFFDSQTEKVKDKIDHVLFVISAAERIPVKFLKHIEGLTDFMKSVLNMVETFSESFVALIMEDWSFYSMDFKRNHQKRQHLKLRKP